MRNSKPITQEEAQFLFLKHVASLVNYWEKESRVTETREKLEGLAFSMLTVLDGCSMGLPAYKVTPMSSSADIDFAKDNGFDYYPEQSSNDDLDIAGSLHDQIYKFFSRVEPPANLYDFGAYLATEAKKFHES